MSTPAVLQRALELESRIKLTSHSPELPGAIESAELSAPREYRYSARHIQMFALRVPYQRASLRQQVQLPVPDYSFSL